VIDDEELNLNEHGRKHKRMIEAELKMEEKQEHKNTKIHEVMEKNGKKMKEENAYEMEEIWSHHLECGLPP